MENSFCIVPFTEVNVIHNRVGFCCMNEESFSLDNTGTNAAFGKFKTFDKIKQEFLDGKRPASCGKCFFQESQGGVSPRINRNNIYLANTGISFDEMVNKCQIGEIGIVQIFMFFSNLCNLACRMCVPESSSTIASLLKVKVVDENAISDAARLEFYKQLLEKNKNTLQKITFSGGEFFMDPGCFAFFNDPNVLETLMGLEKVIVNTNASKTQHGKLDFSKTLSDMKNLVLGISIDGPPGPVLDYIRAKIDSTEFDRTIRHLIEQTGNRQNVFFSFTLQAYNVLYVTETLRYILENFDKNTINVMMFRWVFNKELDIRILPKEIIAKAINKLESFNIHELTQNTLIISQFETLKMNIKSIMSEPRDMVGFSQFKEAVKFFDSLHNTSVLTILPELEGLV